ncbi:hypothetical protein [Vibrio phage Va-ZX-1]
MLRLLLDLFLVLFVMLQEFCKIPLNLYKWFERKGWKDKEIN